MNAFPQLVRQIGRFGLVGAAATVAHVALFSAMISYSGVAPWLANLGGFAAAFAISFLGHSFWTFADATVGWSQANRRLRRFVIVALFGLALNALVVHLVTTTLALPYGYAAVLMATVVPAVMFLASRCWAFALPERMPPAGSGTN